LIRKVLDSADILAGNLAKIYTYLYPSTGYQSLHLHHYDNLDHSPSVQRYCVVKFYDTVVDFDHCIVLSCHNPI
jgi:hypothetical protein